MSVFQPYRKTRIDHGGPLQMQRGGGGGGRQNNNRHLFNSSQLFPQVEPVQAAYTAPTGLDTLPVNSFSPADPSPGVTPGIDWSTMGPTTFGSFTGSSKDKRQAIANWLGAQVNFQTFMHNRRTDARDFAEGVRRWNAEHGWGRQQDLQSMNLANRQQTLAEAQTAAQAQQWATQFNYQRMLNGAQMAQAERFRQYDALGRAMSRPTSWVSSFV